MIDMARFREELPLSNNGAVGITLPCHDIPMSRNTRFFDRQDTLHEIESFLKPNCDRSGILSVGIWGLGGVGKSQIALEYAWRKQTELDAVIWVDAENEMTLQQGLSHVATDCLHLPGADLQAHQQNVIRMMDWLKRTSQ